MPDYRGWEIVRSLGEGGQGEVFLARSPGRVRERRAAIERVKAKAVRLNGVGHGPEDHNTAAQELAEAVVEYARPEAADELGAFKIPAEGEESTRAVQRLKNEIDALRAIDGTPSVLRVIDFDADERWMITDYQPGGSLINHAEAFKGNVQASLQALRPIIAAVAKLHARGSVHRDIKPQNILFSSSGQLVLGDFGIVFFEPEKRPTESLERVGSRDWMAPWAHIGMRVDEVKPSFDVFPLGKVIWSMISGRAFLPFWYHRNPEYDLTKIFPNDTSMHMANELLDHCVVQFEKDCLPSARELLDTTDTIVRALGRGGQTLSGGVPLLCSICSRGWYRRVERDPIALSPYMGWIRVTVHICNYCGNVSTFAVNPPK